MGADYPGAASCSLYFTIFIMFKFMTILEWADQAAGMSHKKQTESWKKVHRDQGVVQVPESY